MSDKQHKAGQAPPSAAELRAAEILIARGQLAKAQASKGGAKLMPAERFIGREGGPPTFVEYARERLAHWQDVLKMEQGKERKRAGQREGNIAKLSAKIAALGA